MIDGVVNDSTYETKEEARQDADADFYYECIGDDLLFGLERGVEFVYCKETYFGNKVILKIERSKVAFDRNDYIPQDMHPDATSMISFI
jgi:hypothetical protein